MNGKIMSVDIRTGVLTETPQVTIDTPIINHEIEHININQKALLKFLEKQPDYTNEVQTQQLLKEDY
jgi:hypothetical protein